MELGANWVYMVIGILGLTVTTFATRSSFFVLPARFELPAGVERLLRYAPACALAAIVVPGVLAPDGSVHLRWDHYPMWAAIAATAVFLRWRNMMAMIAVGLLVFTALRLWA